MRLSKRTVEGLTPAETDYLVFDDAVTGFAIRVFPSGRKTFLVQYRSGGRTRRVKIGSFGGVTVDEARIEARKITGSVARKENPAETIAIERRAPTMAAVCERFMTDHVAVKCKASTAVEYRRSVELFIKPAFGTHKVQDITRTDIANLHHKMRDKPYQANRTLGVLSKIFTLCEIWGLRRDGSNPCRHVPRYPEKKKERFLSELELSRLGAILDDAERDGSESRAAINAIRLLILTGCRLKEIQTLQWSFVKGPYIELPDSKTGARKIPVSQTTQAVLDRIERLPDNPYVITGIVEGQHLTDLQHPWRRIRARAGLDDVRIHDLRHTYASNAVAQGLPIQMVGKLLGHSQIQTTMRYAHLADDPIREAAAMVSGSLFGAMGKRSTPEPEPEPIAAVAGGNVIALPIRSKVAR